MTEENVTRPTSARRLAGALPDVIRETVVHRGETTIVVRRERVQDVLAFLRDDPELRFNHLSDVTAVDGLSLGREPRFAIVYHLYSLPYRERVRIKVPVPADDPVVPSVVSLWPAANWLEREVYDMFGISFRGHPNLERILMPDDWTGHPLRKDQPIIEEETEFSHNVERLRRGLKENV